MAAGQKPAIMIALALMALGCQTRPRMPSPESAFGGTTWRVDAIGDHGALDKAPATPTFEKSGERVAGSTGCNNYFATVQIRRAGVSPDGSQFADPTATAALAAHDFVCSRGAATAIFHEDVFKVKVFKG